MKLSYLYCFTSAVTAVPDDGAQILLPMTWTFKYKPVT